MEPLKEVCVVRDGPSGDPGYLYKVANGVSYSMHHRRNLDALIVTDVIFRPRCIFGGVTSMLRGNFATTEVARQCRGVCSTSEVS